MKEFERDTIEQFVGYQADKFGIDKNYIVDVAFNEEVQKNWNPKVGDIILGCTGNLFVISGEDNLHESLGGSKFYFGGSGCVRGDGNVINSTKCYTMNRDGKYITWKHGSLQEVDNLDHSGFSDFRWIPRPESELKRAGL